MSSLATPIVGIIALLVLGLVFAGLRRRSACRKAGWWLVLAGTLAFLALSLKPVANVLTCSLECRYASPSQETRANLDIVAVLGAGVYPQGGLRREAELNGPSYSRVYAGVKAFKQSGASLLAFCGGPAEEPEADAMKAMAVDLGVPEGQILTERQSRNTFENAAGLAALIGTEGGRRIGLVTSATHMLRSEWVFRKRFPDDVIVPIPANYTYYAVLHLPSAVVPSEGALLRSSLALHEWSGILWYSVRYR